jgi:hypothetical protein
LLEAVEASPEELLASSAAIETDDPYTSTAAYAMLGIDRSGELSPALRSTLETRGAFARMIAGSAGGPGLLTVRTDRPVTEHFGVAAWSVDHVLYGGESGRADGIEELLRSALGELRERGASLVSVRVRADDLAALAAFQSHGFQVTDTMVTHSIKPRRPDQPMALRREYGDLTIMAHTTELLPDVDSSVVDAFADLLFRYYRTSRFHADRRLDPDLASSYYSRWCREAFAGRWSDGVIAAYRGSEPVGFVAGKFDDLAIEASGIKIYGTGLAVSSGHGGFSALVTAIADDVDTDISEFTTHVSNFPVHAAIANHGSPRTLWATHALHLWLD